MLTLVLYFQNLGLTKTRVLKVKVKNRTHLSISWNHVVFISVLCLTTYIFCTYGGASIGVEMPNCTVGTTVISNIGNIMYIEIPNFKVGATDSSSIGNIMYFEMPNCT